MKQDIYTRNHWAAVPHRGVKHRIEIPSVAFAVDFTPSNKLTFIGKHRHTCSVDDSPLKSYVFSHSGQQTELPALLTGTQSATPCWQVWWHHLPRKIVIEIPSWLTKPIEISWNICNNRNQFGSDQSYCFWNGQSFQTTNHVTCGKTFGIPFGKRIQPTGGFCNNYLS